MIDLEQLREKAASGGDRPIGITPRYAQQVAAEIEQGRIAMAELARLTGSMPVCEAR